MTLANNGLNLLNSFEKVIMKKPLILALSLLSMVHSSASTSTSTNKISVGNQTISIPNPDGLIISKHKNASEIELEKSLKSSVPDTTRMIWFLSPDNKTSESRYSKMNISEECYIAIHEDYANIEFDDEDFYEVKKLIKKSNEKYLNKQTSRDDKKPSLDTSRSSASRENMIDFYMEDISKDIFLESEIGRVYQPKNEGFDIFKPRASATALVHVNNKALQVGCISLGNNLDWAKTTTLAWASEIVSANTKIPQGNPLKTRGNWLYEKFVDKLRKKTTYIAKLRSRNSVDLGYPYEDDVRLTLEIRGTSHDGSIVFHTNDGLLSCLDRCRALVRFDDDKIRNLDFKPFDHDFDAMALSTSQQQWFFNKLKSSSKIYIELSYYKKGVRQFEFDSGNLIWNHYDFSD